jgi:non-ribosomal peptide synthetase component F
MDSMRAYWQAVLENTPQPLNLPYCVKKEIEPSHKKRIEKDMEIYFRPVPEELCQEIAKTVFNAKPLEDGASYSVAIHGEIYNRIKELSIQSGVSMFTVLTSSLYLLGATITGQNDICLGSPVNIRNMPELDLQVGWFLDTLLLRQTVVREKTFNEFMHEVNDSNAEALENRLFPFEYILNELDISTDVVGNLFLHLIDFEQHGSIPAHKLASFHNVKGTPTFDLNFTFHQYIDGLHLTIDYRDKLFKPDIIEGIANTYLDILHTVSYDPGLQISVLMENSTKHV